MRKYQLILLLFVVTALSAFAISAQKRTPRVSLIVSIENGNATRLNGIMGDGVDYVDGTNSVTAGIDEYGWFGFNSGLRPVTANYGTPILIQTAGYPTGTETGTKVTIKTFVTSRKFQDMTVGEVQCVGAALTFEYGDAAGTQRSTGYRRGDTNSASAKVTRTDADTWTIESAVQPDCGQSTDPMLDNVAIVRQRQTKGKATPEIVYGSYIMPFKMTLRRRL